MVKTEGLTPREKKKHGNVVSSGSLELFSIDLIGGRNQGFFL